MKDIIQSVFHEYTRLRLNGLEAAEAVRTLHPHLEDFDQNMRDELARNMRAWENQRTEKITFDDRKKLAKAAEARDAADTIKCPNCGRQNVAKESICYSCGSLLNPVNANATDILPPQTGELAIDDARYRQTYLLLLMPDDGDDAFTLRPQMSTTGLTLGRGNEASDEVDVDLERVGASKHGVSRIHAIIMFDEIPETLSVVDTGSTNGSFINGQKLHPNERRTLRHGDRLRLGRLGFQVIYKDDAS